MDVNIENISKKSQFLFSSSTTLSASFSSIEFFFVSLSTISESSFAFSYNEEFTCYYSDKLVRSIYCSFMAVEQYHAQPPITDKKASNRSTRETHFSPL